MRLLVFSDSHGNSSKMLSALMLHPEADVIVHLGDGEYDVDCLRSRIGSRKLVQVCGNCDQFSFLPENDIIIAEGKKVLCTHGHKLFVKRTADGLLTRAMETGSSLVLYGHTHEPLFRYENGIYLFNPGSARVGEYGIADITASGILCSNACI